MTEWIFAAIEASEVARMMRFSRWAYAFVNTGHVLGIALLVGGIVPLDLRLLGLWRDTALAPLARILTRTAAAGLALALATGLLLFSARPVEYAALSVFQAKLLLVLLGTGSALAIHAAFGAQLAKAPERLKRLAGVVSLISWIGALVAGRMIAFLG